MKKKLLTAILILMFNVLAKGQHNTYYIGHSGFGWDLIVGEMVNDLAADAQITTYNYGYQFIGGTCLTNQWYTHGSPQGGTDSWEEIQTGAYDIIVLAEQIPIQEVIYGSVWCNQNILTSVEAVDNFYDMAVAANPNTQVYLMEFHNEIDQTSATPYIDWVNINADMRPLWEQVADSVSLINSRIDVCIFPVSAAFQALADSVIAGVYPGTSNWLDIFDPNDLAVATIHPTEETYYLVACVLFAKIFGQSPVGLTNLTYAADGWPFDPPTTQQANMMQKIAWEIVSNDTYVCDSPITGINENSIADIGKTLICYPNPSANMVTFKAIDSQFESAEMKLYNFSGKEVKDIQNINGTEFSLNLKNIARGIYFYKIEYQNGLSVHGKLIVE